MKLHNRILAGMLLGAVFGGVFPADYQKLVVRSLVGQEQVSKRIEGWKSLRLLESGETIEAVSGSEDPARILRAFEGLTGVERKTVVLRVDGEDGFHDIRHVVSIEKAQSLPMKLKPVGTLFIRLLMFVAVPLVFASLIVGASSLGNLSAVGRIGAKMLGLYALTTTAAITIGLAAVNAIRPGTRLSASARERLMEEFPGAVVDLGARAEISVIDRLLSIVPTNPVRALAEGEMLQVIFFALVIGVMLTLIAPNKSKPIIDFFDGFSDLMIRAVNVIMKLAPYGVFALIASTVSEFGFGILQTLGWYVGTVLAALALHLFGVVGVLVRTLGRMSPAVFFRGVRDAQLISFSSSSSAATLPVTMECCEKNLGVSNRVASFCLPLGATINMDGTSLYQAVAAVFIAQVYGLDLSIGGQLTILLTALLASVGTAPVPGVGIVMLIIVLRSVNIPEEGIALILGVDRVIDMFRTMVNVSGDAAVAVVLERQEKRASIGGRTT